MQESLRTFRASTLHLKLTSNELINLLGTPELFRRAGLDGMGLAASTDGPAGGADALQDFPLLVCERPLGGCATSVLHKLKSVNGTRIDASHAPQEASK